MRASVVAALGLVVAATSPAAASCRWWGDGEHGPGSPPVLFDAGGGALADARDSVDELVQAADRFRTGDRLPRSYPDALRRYRLAAERGHIGAQYNLASMYHRGMGVERAEREALRWYLLASHAGDVHARHRLGELYRSGSVTARNPREGARWIRAAEQSGHAEFFADPASLYWRGDGLRRAPLAGDAAGTRGVALVSTLLDEAALEVGERQAASWLERWR